MKATTLTNSRTKIVLLAILLVLAMLVARNSAANAQVQVEKKEKPVMVFRGSCWSTNFSIDSVDLDEDATNGIEVMRLTCLKLDNITLAWGYDCISDGYVAKMVENINGKPAGSCWTKVWPDEDD